MTTKEVADILNSTAKRVAELCRTGKIYGIRSDGPFGTWDIPEDSLGMYLRYNPIYRLGLRVMTYVTGGETVRMLSVYDEEYTIADLAKIFGETEKTVKSWLRKGYFPWMKVKWYTPLTKRTRISMLFLMYFLNAPGNGCALEHLQHRHKELLASGHEDESIVRHVLMVHSYYMSNGYLI